MWKWRVINTLLLALGVYILYNAYDVLYGFFYGARGTGFIYRLGFPISLNDNSILTYGFSFTVAGIALLLTPIAINRKKKKVL